MSLNIDDLKNINHQPNEQQQQRYQLNAAVYFALIKDGGILLQLRQGSSYMNNHWGVPAGHLERGESGLQAVVREVREELGIQLNQSDLIFSMVQHRVSDGYLGLWYTVKPDAILPEPKIMEPHKCAKMAFFDLRKLPQPIVPELRDYLLARLNGQSYCEAF